MIPLSMAKECYVFGSAIFGQKSHVEVKNLDSKFLSRFDRLCQAGSIKDGFNRVRQNTGSLILKGLY